VILVDSNVLLDLFTGDPSWAGWSETQLAAARLRGRLVVNGVIYAELSIRYDRLEEVDTALERGNITVMEIPRPALFLAGKVFLAYRRRGGTKSSVLPDFFIGAHAAVLGVPLLTRDTRRYRAYFPTLELVAPEP
jgi:predicted nucleic acid-binding protein